MPTQEIPRDEWVAFFDSISRQHQGWLVTIEILDSGLGAQVAARELALKGITAELKGAGADAISIIVGKAPTGHITHIVTAPSQVWLELTQEGAHAALAIESAGGATTLVRFRSAVRPELVDGVVFE
jgi:hypothetical protein